MLLTASALVSSSTATSSARQRSTSRRISTARCRGARCCSAAMKASRTDWRIRPARRGRLAGSGCRVPAGSRSIPVGHHRAGLHSCATGATSMGSPRARPVLQHVEADVGGDPVEPRSQPGSVLERRQRPPGAQHRVLNGVLGFVYRSEHPVAVAGQLAAVGAPAARARWHRRQRPLPRLHRTLARRSSDGDSPAGVSKYAPGAYSPETTRSTVALPTSSGLRPGPERTR